MQKRVEVREREWGALRVRSPLRHRLSVQVCDAEQRRGLIAIHADDGTPYAGGIIIFEVQLRERHPYDAPAVSVHLSSQWVAHPLISGARILHPLFSPGPASSADGKWKSTDTLERVAQVLVDLFVPNPMQIKNALVKPESLENQIYNRTVCLNTLRGMAKMIARPTAFDKLLRAHLFTRLDWFVRTSVSPPYCERAVPAELLQFAQVGQMFLRLAEVYNTNIHPPDENIVTPQAIPKATSEPVEVSFPQTEPAPAPPEPTSPKPAPFKRRRRVRSSSNAAKSTAAKSIAAKSVEHQSTPELPVRRVRKIRAEPPPEEAITIQRRTFIIETGKPSKRKMPSGAAKEHPEGYSCVSDNDGRRWCVRRTKSGMRWVLVA